MGATVVELAWILKLYANRDVGRQSARDASVKCEMANDLNGGRPLECCRRAKACLGQGRGKPRPYMIRNSKAAGRRSSRSADFNGLRPCSVGVRHSRQSSDRAL